MSVNAFPGGEPALFLFQQHARVIPGAIGEHAASTIKLLPGGQLAADMPQNPAQLMVAGIEMGVEPTEFLQELMVPLVTLSVGLFLSVSTKTHQLVGPLLTFFGAQTFMDLYMKFILSRCAVSREKDLAGVPAPFVITATQQLVSFVLLVCTFAFTAYKPRPVQTKSDRMSVFCLSLCFTLNIALNSFSMVLLDLSVNLMIRSCAPLITYLCQIVIGRTMGTAVVAKHIKSMVLLVVGALCSCAVVLAKSESMPTSSVQLPHMILGIASCVSSLMAAAAELNVISIMGTSARLNVLDAIYHLAVPVALWSVPPTFMWSHPTDWPGQPMTDFAIIKEVWALQPKVIGLMFLSGLFALLYNLLLYSIIQALSAAHAAVASNFNKTAVIAIAYAMGMEALPQSPWNYILVLGVLGNSVALAAFGYVESIELDGAAALAAPIVGKERDPAVAIKACEQAADVLHAQHIIEGSRDPGTGCKTFEKTAGVLPSPSQAEEDHHSALATKTGDDAAGVPPSAPNRAGRPYS